MVEAPRNLQLPSGYDEEFVYEVEDDFICSICQLTLKEPVQTRCGHRFCNACLEEHLRRQEVQNQPYTCPADRKGLDRDRDVFPDNATGRKILSMMIKCPSDGCLWTGELRNKEAHLEACPFKIVTCTSENCHVTVKRKDLEQHVTDTCEWRIIECEYCEDLHPKRHVQDHLENCSKIPLPCPNSCGDVIPREMIPNHIDKDCPLLVPCPYAQMGCNKKFLRENVDSHLESNMREHFEFACVQLNSTQVLLNKQRVQLDKTRVQLDETRDQLDETQVNLYATRGQLDETRVQLVETKAKLSRLTQDQLKNTQEYQESTRKLNEKLRALQMQMGMEVDTDKDGGCNKRFVWKIKSYSESLRQAREGVKKKIESDPFYTGRYGYKLKVFAHPYFKELSPISPQFVIGIVLMEGKYDGILPWPFSRKITFTIIDQNSDLKERKNYSHFFSPRKRELKDMKFLERPGGKVKAVESEPLFFIPHKVLITRRYIVNNTLFLEVDVGPDD